MLPRTLRDNNIAIVLNLQHLAPGNPTRFSISEENAPTDNGIDRNDAPHEGRFGMPGNEKRNGGGHHTDPRHDKPLNAQEERFYDNVTKR
jgi:hypothetical protein